MNETDHAMVGDMVAITFGSGDGLQGVVKHIPMASVDSWTIHGTDGTITHVQQFETICVLNRKWNGEKADVKQD